MLLDSHGRVEKEELRFVQVKGGPRGFTKIIENRS
jgi:hypothetical protein